MAIGQIHTVLNVPEEAVMVTVSAPTHRPTGTVSRRITAAGAVVVLALAVSACSGETPTAPGSVTQVPTPTLTTATAPVPDPTVVTPVPTPAPTTPAPAPEPCTLESLHRTAGMEALDVLIYCDGTWMRAGQWQTDHLRNLTWDGDMWVEYPPDGHTDLTGYPCYDADRIAQDGVPPAVRDQLTLCG